MGVTPPSPERVRRLGAQLGFDIEPAQAAEFADRLSRVAAYSTLEEFATVRRDASPATDPGGDPYNAFIVEFDLGGGDGPLSGLDVALKDNVAVAGVPMTCGSRALAGAVPGRHAAVTDRLLDAGARVVGKTNMDEFAYGPTGETSAFGPSLNPVDTDHVTGGSSSGSAAAVAGGLADAALGSDTGGSVRIPASFCGIVGFKPSYGMVPRVGFVDLSWSLDHIGVFARDVPTATRVYETIAGPDERDPSSLGRTVSVPDHDGSAAVEGLSFAVPEQLMNDVIEPGVHECVTAAFDELEAAGASIETVSIPLIERVPDIWDGIINPEFATAFRTGGVPIGRRAGYDVAWNDAFAGAIAANGDALGDIVVRKLLEGMAVVDRTGGRLYTRAHEARRLFTRSMTAALDGHDALLSPTMPTTAPEVGAYEPYGDGPPMSWTTRPVNLAGLPAISVPCGRTDGLPVGLQFIGPQGGDRTVLDLGARYEALTSQ